MPATDMRGLGWLLAAIATAALLWTLSDVVMLVFAAILLAVLLRGAALLLARYTRLPVGGALAVIILLLVSVCGGFGWYFGPRFVSEGQQLLLQIQHYAGHLQQDQGFWGRLARRAMAAKGDFAIAPLAPKVLTMTFGTGGGILLLLATTLYLAISPDLYLHGIIRLLPVPRRRRAEDIAFQLCQTLRYWMLGQLVDMGVVGVLSMTGLALLGIPLPLALGVLAGLLTFVPYVGAILAGIPAVILASTVGKLAVLWVVLLYTGCHLVEGYLVAPLVSRRTVALPPAVTILAMAVLGELFGFMGLLLATPLAAAVILLVREIYVRDYLEG